MTTTLSDNKTETIEHLDFRPSCCCEAHFCGTHPHMQECGAEAAVMITIHQVNHCTGDDPDVSVDADGNEVGPMCVACHDRAVDYTSRWLERLLAAARRLGGVPACGTCGAPIMHVSDVIRDVRPLK